MWKRYLLVYWIGMFYSMVIGTSIIFVYLQYKKKETQKRYDLIYDADQGADLFEKYRMEMKMLGDYYERIEDWDFSYVSFAAAVKLPDPQILIVDIVRGMEKRVSYLYMPNGAPTIEGYTDQNVVIKSLEDGWYYICIKYEGEICY